MVMGENDLKAKIDIAFFCWRYILKKCLIPKLKKREIEIIFEKSRHETS